MGGRGSDAPPLRGGRSTARRAHSPPPCPPLIPHRRTPPLTASFCNCRRATRTAPPRCAPQCASQSLSASPAPVAGGLAAAAASLARLSLDAGSVGPAAAPRRSCEACPVPAAALASYSTASLSRAARHRHSHLAHARRPPLASRPVVGRHPGRRHPSGCFLSPPPDLVSCGSVRCSSRGRTRTVRVCLSCRLENGRCDVSYYL